MDDRQKQRFAKLHEYFKQKFGAGHLVKLLALLFGLLFVLIGIILLFIPGPGFLFLIIGFGLLSLLSKRLAHYLDELELRIKAGIAKLKNRN